jgi:hypothetical protein
MTSEISEKAKENLRRNEDSRRRESKYIKLQSGQKMVLHFDPEKMNRSRLNSMERRVHDINMS